MHVYEVRAAAQDRARIADKRRLTAQTPGAANAFWMLYSARRCMIESQLRMKRTLLAIGIAVLVSMMLMPRVVDYNGVQVWLPFFVDTAWLPANWHVGDIQWTQFILQTVFVAVAAAVIVNLFPHRPRR